MSSSEHRSTAEKARHPFPNLREKLKDTHLYDAKVKFVETKHHIGKIGNIFNPNHRHDEEHEQKTDEKRTKTAESHRFHSFAPEHEGNNIKWYVDGRDYFWFLRRPPYFNQEWRLDQILKRRAEAGVKIYIIVYKEVNQALTCNSAHTKNALRDLCPEGMPGHGNITFMRHPDHNFLENAGDMTFYWAHHEKFIVIDYNVAFIGGLDLCFGRWDNQQHPMADAHPSGVKNEIWPGQDWNNRWNFVKRDKYKRDERFCWLTMAGLEGEDEDIIAVQRPKHPLGGYVHHPLTPLEGKARGNQGTVHAQIVRSSADWSSGILTEHSIQNAYSETIRNAQHFVYIENQFFITATGDEQAPIHNTIGKAIVDACVRAGKEGRKFRVIVVIPTIPGFAGDLRADAATGTRAIMDYQYKSINRGEHSIMGQITAQGVDPRNHIFFFNLRSYDRLNKTAAMEKQEEISGVRYQDVQRAEAEEIMGDGILGDGDASSSSDEDTKRDPKAKEEKERMVDQKRRFEAKREEAGLKGEVKSSDSIAKDAMLNEGKPSEEYWEGDPEAEKENFVQEELYIHGKLLIADDKIAICGSSNINDRSQLGLHDSELAIVMEDTNILESTMDGQPYQAGHHAATLRRYLWREHLGLLKAQPHDATDDPNAQPPGDCPNDVVEGEEYEFVADPLSDKVWDLWTSQAATNTNIFRHLFHADPDDNIKTFEDYDKFFPSDSIKQGHLFDPYMPVADVRAKLDQIKGHLVWMPLDFLKDAELAETGLQVNSWTESIYT
ncbi:MAG: hypothetical protein M1837_002232 [Sclerophora amabilis]|nr:MAG: hypothetical protein M1837_002232 [Sclerophora amabilis]